MPTRRLSPFLALAAALSVASCEAPISAPQPADIYVEIELPAITISTVVVEVEAVDITTPLAFPLTVSGVTASGTITIPSGTARLIRVRAFDAIGIETHNGTAVRNVVPGTNPALAITLLPRGASLPITISVGAITITLTPANDTLAVGDTARILSSVTDGVSPIPDATTVWASLHPAVATVSTNGLVTARTPGVATVIGTYGGVGAAASVTVAGTTGGTTGLPACLTAGEVDLVNAINAIRADSGRPALAVDTRLVRAARLNASRVRDNTSLDSLEWGGAYGLTSAAADFAWGQATAVTALNAWIAGIASSPTRAAAWATILGTNGRLIGVARDALAGSTPTPRWVVQVSTSVVAADTAGTCDP